MDYPGWTVETTHPIDPEAEGYDATCADLVEPTIAMAEAWDSSAFGQQVTDAQGVDHLVIVRKIVE